MSQGVDTRLCLPKTAWPSDFYQGESSYRRLLHEGGLSQQQTERQYRSRADEQTVADFEAMLEKK